MIRRVLSKAGAGTTVTLVPGNHDEYLRRLRAFVEGAAALARRPECLPEMRRCARAHAAAVDWPSVVEVFEALLTCPLVERPGSALGAGPSGRRDEQAREQRHA